MKTAKKIYFDSESILKLKEGVDILANAVSSTLGPKGRVAILQNPYGSPILTKDGVTVSRHINLSDPMQDMGASLIKDVAEKTVSQCGDGTTTSCILAQDILERGVKAIQEGKNPIELRKEMDEAVEVAIKYIKENAIPVGEDWDKVKNIAIISTNNDIQLGTLISDTLKKVGKHGALTVSTGTGLETTVDYVEGMHFDKGFISPYFITNPDKNTAELDNPYILIFDKDIEDLAELLPIIEQCYKQKKQLLIIANDVIGSALSGLVVNKVQQGFPVCAVYAPSRLNERKEIFQDIATVTGASIVSEEFGKKLKQVVISDLGQCEKVIVTHNNTLIIGGKGSRAKISDRELQLEAQINLTEQEELKEGLRVRLAKMASGVAIIKVGGKTDAEAKERKDRVDDAVGATKSAIKEGILAGGGKSYINAATEVYKIKTEGADLISKSLFSPAKKLQLNCGILIDDVKYESDPSIGFNALTGKNEDLIASGVIDSAMVLRCCLENAASIVGLMLTSNASIIYENLPE